MMYRVALVAIACLAASPEARAQDSRPWGRVSFFATTSHVSVDQEGSRGASEFVTAGTYRSPELSEDGVEYAVDARLANYAGLDRDARVSVYDGWVGLRLLDGALAVRGGQMWLTDLGGLGAVTGGFAEYRHPLPHGRLRLAGFGGMEPEGYDLALASGVTRVGGYAAWDGAGFRRSVLGYVMVRHGTLTERSVLTMTNFVPIGRQALVYQAAEIDLQGPGGQGHGGLTYFFINSHVAATRIIDVQGTFHRGRSIDARTITENELAGRPVLPQSLEGLLFESASARVTVTVAQGVRVFGGFGQDRNNRQDPTVSRVTAGGSVANVFRSGLDVTASYSRLDRQSRGSYSAWYASAGRSLSPRVYVTGDFSSSVSLLRLFGAGGILIETRPSTRRLSGTAIVNLSRSLSLLATVEHTTETSASANRVLAGLTWRIQ